MAIHQIVYISSATELLSKSALVELLAKSRTNNTKRGVTGMLLYKDGNIMQVLEGDVSTVKELFAKIQRDPRHRGVLTLLRRELAAREFPDWSMAFRDLEDQELQKQPGYNDTLNMQLTPDALEGNPSRAVRLISTFAASMR